MPIQLLAESNANMTLHMSSALDHTSSITAVVQLVRSLMPWWAISVSSLAVVSFRAKLLLVMICGRVVV